MPNNIHKSAAVPFVNQKGERSMKRVKVERYVAGKKPSYAKDEDEEYYTTDDEEDFNPDEEEETADENSDSSERDDPEGQRPDVSGRNRKVGHREESPEEDNKGQTKPKLERPETPVLSDDDDDPRFRMLKKLETKSDVKRLIDSQMKTPSSFVAQVTEDRKVILDEDEDEDEIRQRHNHARARTLEEPIGPQAIFGDLDQQLEDRLGDIDDAHRPKKEQTDDILKDFKLEGLKPKKKKEKEISKTEEKIKEMIEHAKQEAIMKAQLHKKIEEDNKRELEREALIKNDVGTNELESIKTDDEDEELAYEEWKLREIKRVLRDRSERLELEARAK